MSWFTFPLGEDAFGFFFCIFKTFVALKKTPFYEAFIAAVNIKMFINDF